MPIFGTRQKNCAACGKDIDINAKFCPHCGQPTETTLGPCPHCGQPIAANAKFCPSCGRQLGGQRGPDVRGSVWRKSPDEFAVRVEPADLRGTLYKELEVQPGQQVVLLVDGRADEERRGPGRYTVESLFDRLLTLGAGRHITGLLVDGGYVPMEFQIPEIYTQDDYQVSARCVVGVQVANPVAFFSNVLKSQRTLTVSDLRNLLFDEVRDAVQDVIGGQDLRGLATGLAMRDRLADAVDVYLNNTLATSGLSFGGVRTVEVSHPRLEALRKQWEEIRLARDAADADRTQAREQKLAEVKQREALWEAQIQAEELETREQRDQVHTYEERAEVWEQARRALLSDQMNQVRTKEDLADFMATVNKRQVLRREELDVLAEDFEQRKEDRDKARAHAAYLAELERDYNRKQAELVWRTDFTLEDMAAALKVAQQRLADEGLLDGKRWDNDMAALRRQADRAEWDRVEAGKQALFDRQRERDEQQLRLDLDRAETLHQAEIQAIRTNAALTDTEKRKKSEVALAGMEAEKRRIEMEIERLENDEELRLAREGIGLLGEMKKVKRVDDEETRRIAREDELARARDAHQRTLEAEAQRQKHELDRLTTLGTLSTEALIAASGPEQGTLLVSLARTKALEGKTAEEILALAAEHSPAVAEAFKEKFKAMAEGRVGEREQALYERMMAEQKELAQIQRAMAEEQARRQQELATDALRTQADVAKAFAQSRPAAGPTVVIPGSGAAYGGPTVVGDAGVTGGEVQACPRCRVKSPVGEKYCANCGFNFYQA